jgi:hypothetical protein
MVAKDLENILVDDLSITTLHPGIPGAFRPIKSMGHVKKSSKNTIFVFLVGSLVPRPVVFANFKL